MTKLKLSLNCARRAVLNAQGLDGRAKLPRGKEGVARQIEHLGYTQIDTIAVINRAHDHTLWTRRPDYSVAHLHELLAVDRRVFEYWGHAASLLPMSDYRYYIPLMRRHRNPGSAWVRERLAAVKGILPAVLKRIRAEGPLSSSDFAAPDGVPRGTWWDWKPAKIALELLFWQGELMITKRRNFQRVYDLTERVLPATVDTTCPTEAELGRFLVRRALAAHGFAQAKEIRDHIKSREELIRLALCELLDSGEVVMVEVAGVPGKVYYALADQLDRLVRLRPLQPRLHLLSPFDNLIIDRERTKRLFDFDYTIECYTPAEKRQYGYFCLPVLWGAQLVGRIDPKADRQQRVLVVHSLHLEPGFKPDDAFTAALASKLSALAAFNQCDCVRISRSPSPAFTTELKKQLNAPR